MHRYRFINIYLQLYSIYKYICVSVYLYSYIKYMYFYIYCTEGRSSPTLFWLDKNLFQIRIQSLITYMDVKMKIISDPDPQH
jgi:hypothetical protein